MQGFKAVIIVKTYYTKHGHAMHSVEVTIPGNKTEKITAQYEWQWLAVRALKNLGEDVDLTTFHDKWNNGDYFVSYGNNVSRKRDL